MEQFTIFIVVVAIRLYVLIKTQTVHTKKSEYYCM